MCIVVLIFSCRFDSKGNIVPVHVLQVWNVLFSPSSSPFSIADKLVSGPQGYRWGNDREFLKPDETFCGKTRSNVGRIEVINNLEHWQGSGMCVGGMGEVARYHAVYNAERRRSNTGGWVNAIWEKVREDTRGQEDPRIAGPRKYAKQEADRKERVHRTSKRYFGVALN